ncbi:hypothetical protein TNCV_2289511 [Trichonephila clavipes]|uniref:Uncharacterized protein n=1 Tax=Trichonephila clavipes TaxID=2585209 RepID=A0A8X6UX26_TRICX|nr:hypothetical protein TNCV_2289511 [Trichonephila clavipes]
MGGSRTPVYVFDASTINSQSYWNEILEAHPVSIRPPELLALPEMTELPERDIFTEERNYSLDQLAHDLAAVCGRISRTRIVDEFDEGIDISRIVQPLRSPDLNPMEHINDGLGKFGSQCRSLPTPNKSIVPLLEV